MKTYKFRIEEYKNGLGEAFFRAFYDAPFWRQGAGDGVREDGDLDSLCGTYFSTFTAAQEACHRAVNRMRRRQEIYVKTFRFEVAA